MTFMVVIYTNIIQHFFQVQANCECVYAFSINRCNVSCWANDRDGYYIELAKLGKTR